MSTTTIPSSVTPPPCPRKTLAELLHELGDIPAHRVRLYPYPGTATEADAVRVTNTEGACELVNGTLVEKAMGAPESFLASLLIQFLGPFVRVNKLGMTTVPDGMYRMLRGNIREPDVSFTRKERLVRPLPQVVGWCPDLCVEILSPDNSRTEIATKRGEYFSSGCQLVWEIDVRTRMVTVYTDPTTSTFLTEADTLDGGTVLPGFTLSLAELFAAFDDVNRPTP
ncbi:MAG: hypothetical protein JWO38_3891 [Gemmataceae bacterium]|nr:hypothetical protein [Gemmataceae bacterium]